MPNLTKRPETLPAIRNDDSILFAPNIREAIWHQGGYVDDRRLKEGPSLYLSALAAAEPKELILRGSHHVSELGFQTFPSSASAYGSRNFKEVHLSDWLSGYLATPKESITELKTLFLEQVYNFELEPFGEHPAELTARHMFSSYEIASKKWVMGLDENTKLMPEIIEILGRFRPADDAWRAKCIAEWLQKANVQVRDAAIRAAENWGDNKCISILRAHEEKIDWLRAEIESILQKY